MSYYSFSMNNGRKRSTMFGPVFKNINSGFHNENATVKSSESWSSSKKHLMDNEESENNLSSKIHLAVLFATMLALIISLV